MLKRSYNSLVQKVFMAMGLFIAVGIIGSTAYATEAPVLHYTFDSSTLVNDTIVQDQSGNGYDGILQNEAYLNYDADLEKGILDLGTYDGYLDLQSTTGVLIADLSDFTISTYVYVGPGAALGSWGNMLYTFSNSPNQESAGNGYLFMSLTTQASRNVAYRITTSGGGGEANS